MRTKKRRRKGLGDSGFTLTSRAATRLSPEAAAAAHKAEAAQKAAERAATDAARAADIYSGRSYAQGYEAWQAAKAKKQPAKKATKCPPGCAPTRGARSVKKSAVARGKTVGAAAKACWKDAKATKSLTTLKQQRKFVGMCMSKKLR